MNQELEDQIAALKTLADAHYHQYCVLEDQMHEARRKHEETMKQLNALYTKRSNLFEQKYVLKTFELDLRTKLDADRTWLDEVCSRSAK